MTTPTANSDEHDLRPALREIAVGALAGPQPQPLDEQHHRRERDAEAHEGDVHGERHRLHLARREHVVLRGRPSAPVRSWAARSVACIVRAVIDPPRGRATAAARRLTLSARRRRPTSSRMRADRDLHPPRRDPPGGSPHSRGLRGVPAARYALGAPAPVPHVWPRRLLRLVARPPRAPARARRSATRSSSPSSPERTGAGASSTRPSSECGRRHGRGRRRARSHADRDRSLADGGRHALDRAAAHVAGGDDAREARFEREWSLRVILAGVGTGEDVAVVRPRPGPTGLASRAADLSQGAMHGPPNPAGVGAMASGAAASAANRPQQAQRQCAESRPALGAGALAVEAARVALGLAAVG